ncbi:hypothetical protein CCM_02353 [Cordyceps militaris CM01]|uniref:Uncharacterized protein n=1 Tax=Cordyceps militaris (strain CM01) TaxID=983644 RepID=G3J9A3_CORMM|nr:uncharacterized protein CCM_02353 [Cordyceps militaris CM01]EGX94082.1 hypothetical protein CCM_02353 [Cordyceps militaris CM01]
MSDSGDEILHICMTCVIPVTVKWRRAGLYVLQGRNLFLKVSMFSRGDWHSSGFGGRLIGGDHSAKSFDFAICLLRVKR